MERMKTQVELLKESCDMKDAACVRYQKRIAELEKENRKLKNSIEYRKKKADANQEKANQIDKIMKLPGVMVDGKIDWSKVAVYYMM